MKSVPVQRLVACHDCDLLLRRPALAEGAAASCPRCGALLARRSRNGLERTLAFTLTALILFAIANSFPIVAVEVQGLRSATTLLGAVQSLRDQGMDPVAALVFVTTFVVPLLELGLMAWLLLPLRLGRRPPGLAPLMRLTQMLRPWGMVEVFLLGVLVSLVKLSHLATVVPGIALWSFAALMVSIAAAAASFDADAVWERVQP